MRLSWKALMILALVPGVVHAYGGSYTGLEYREKLKKQKEADLQAQQKAQQKAGGHGTIQTNIGGAAGASSTGGGFYHGAGGFGGQAQGGAGGKVAGGGATAAGTALGGGGGGGAPTGGGATAGPAPEGGLQCPPGSSYINGRCSMGATSNNNTSTGGGGIVIDNTNNHAPAPIHTVDPGAAGGCFAAGTPVSTPQGERAIEKLKVGDEIYAIDTETYELVRTRVARVFHHRHLRTPRVRVTLANGEKIVATTIHGFYDPARRDYVAIRDFKPGDKVVWLGKADVRQEIAIAGPARVPAELRRQAYAIPSLPSDRVTAVAKEVAIVSIEPLGDSPTDVFNLMTESELHNYLADGVLVHNLKPVKN